MSIRDLLVLAGFIALSEGVGIIGSLATSPAIPTWYAALIRPELAPPNWLFAPVWTVLFFLMGFAAFLVWRKGFVRSDVKMALALFVFQLILNTVWSVIFFGFQNLGVAFMEILFLWCAIVATMVAFVKISRTAMLLLVPYILWVSFAVYLNYLFWMLN